MSEAAIHREIVLDPSVVPPLDESVLSLSPDETAFLRSKISANDEELKQKLLEAQRLAYANHAYPCIRAFHFVNLFMSINPIYSKVLEVGKSHNTILVDLGCCMGSDVRKLVTDGYPADNVFGCDLRPEFITIGHKLYNDSPHSSHIRFFTSDIFDIPGTPTLAPPSLPITPATKVTDLSQLAKKIDHFYTGALFHLFSEEAQYALALRIARLIKRSPGTIIFGRHEGLSEAGYIEDHLGRTRYGHSCSSWPLLWKQIFTQIESQEFAEKRVIVDAILTAGFGKNAIGTRHDARMLVWSVRII